MIDHVPVVVSDRGAEVRAYVQYYGATIARNRAAHRIVIFQDTLERDFGSDPDLHTYVLRAGDPLGERLAEVAEEQGIMLMLCDRCAIERSLAEGEPGDCRPSGTVAGVRVGCFPDLYGALSGNPPDQVITL